MSFLSGLGGFLGSLVPGIGPILGPAIAAGGTLLSNAQNQAYTTQMSNTAYQRGSADMTAAGLNPAAMFGSGGPASSPLGQNQNVGASALSGMQTQIQSAVALKTAEANIANIHADTVNKVASTPNIDAQTGILKAQAVNEGLRGTVLANQGQISQSAALIARNSAKTAQNQSSMDPSLRSVIDQVGLFGSSTSDAIQSAKSLAGMMF